MNAPEISLERAVEFLFEAPLFEGLETTEIADILVIMHVKRLVDGEGIFREGEPGDGWYVIYDGRAEVIKEGAHASPRRVALLERGACVGEMAILDGSPRSATVSAIGDVTLFEFKRDEFDQLLNAGSLAAYKLIAAMARVLSERHRVLTQQVTELLDADGRTEDLNRDAIGAIVDKYSVSE